MPGKIDGFFNKLFSFGWLEDLLDKYLGTGLTTADDEANEFSKQQQEDAQQHDKDMADYNDQLARQYYQDIQSPQAQVQQYIGAGLNPALLYGKGAGSVPSPASFGSSSASTASSVKPTQGDIISLIAGFQGMKLKAQEVKAAVDLKSAESYYQRQQGDLISKQNQIFWENYQLDKQIKSSTINDINASALYKISSSKLAEANITKTEAETSLINWQSMIAKQNAEDQADLNRTIIELRESQIAYQTAETRLANASADVKETEAKYAKDTYDMALEKFKQELERLKKENKLTQNEIDYWFVGKNLDAMLIQSEAFRNYIVKSPNVFGAAGNEIVAPYAPNVKAIQDGSYFNVQYDPNNPGTSGMQNVPTSQPVYTVGGMPVTQNNNGSVSSKAWYELTYAERVQRRKERKRQRSSGN